MLKNKYINSAINITLKAGCFALRLETMERQTFYSFFKILLQYIKLQQENLKYDETQRRQRKNLFLFTEDVLKSQGIQNK